MKKFIIPMALMLVLQGCATSEFTAEKTLNAEQGVLLAQFPCSSVLRQLTLYKSGYNVQKRSIFNKSLTGREAMFRCSDEGQITLIALESGDYFIGDANLGGLFIPESRAYKFTIQPDKINYIGDINTSSRVMNSYRRDYKTTVTNISANIEVNNKFNETVKLLKQEKPSISTKYKIVQAVAKK